MEAKLKQLKAHLNRVDDLIGAAYVLEWEQESYMPEGGGDSRARQLATLHAIAHETFTSDEVGTLLEDLAGQVTGLDADSDEARIIKVAKKTWDQQTRVPSALVNARAEAHSKAGHAWQKARGENDFKAFLPYLERNIELAREYAGALAAGEMAPYDAMLDHYDPGNSAAQIDAVFVPLRAELVELIKGIAANRDRNSDAVLRRHYPKEAQLAFSSEVVAKLGYDFDHGRLDIVTHPFSISIALDDVRITTRVYEDFLQACLMGTIHEAGHAMYEQGISPALDRLGIYPDRVGEGASMSVHESQSRFYENVIGRSLPFWTYWYPKAQAAFPGALGDVDLKTFHGALNYVEPSFIRVEADEVTYGMHIMVRYELEKDVIGGRLDAADLPEAWNSKIEEYLGIRPTTDSDGVLQDVHWSQGYFGYFPDYLLGSIFAAQLLEAMEQDLPDLWDQVERGEYEAILAWKREHIHRHGRKFTLAEISERATGTPLRWEPYMAYLKDRFSAIYGL